MSRAMTVCSSSCSPASVGAAAAMNSGTPSAPLRYTPSSTRAIHPLVAAKLPWDPQRDFAPIGMVGSTRFALIVNNVLPARTLAELIAMARARPGALAYASGGIGGSQHLATALLEDMTGTSMNHVPYEGSGPALTDPIGGQVQAKMEPAVSAAPHVRAGRVRALALTGARRSSAFRDVPAFAETVPGYEAAAWFAILAPAGTPPELVARLSTELRAALRDETDETVVVGARQGGLVACLRRLEGGQRGWEGGGRDPAAPVSRAARGARETRPTRSRPRTSPAGRTGSHDAVPVRGLRPRRRARPVRSRAAWRRPRTRERSRWC
jgi:hypothetical protein